MMLEALVAYADREHLGDPDFESADIRWVIALADGGRLASPIDLRESPKRKLIPLFEQKLLTDARRPRARFLCDALERSVGWFDFKKPERSNRAAGSLAFFKELLRACADAHPADAGSLGAVLHFLNDQDALTALAVQLTDLRAKPNELATFTVDGAWLLDLQGPMAFWRSWCREHRPSSRGPKRLCLATGELEEPVSTFGMIKGIPGGNPQGTIFLSFDKPAFCSYGLKQAENAAISATTALKLRSALNRLIEKSRGERLVFNNTIFLHWTREPMEQDPFALLTGADREAVARLLHSATKGRRVTSLNTDAYYAASLSGNGARIVVRDWIETTVPRIEANVRRWFTELAIVEPAGGEVKMEFRLTQLLWAMANDRLEKPFEALPHGASEDLLHAAITGGPIPQTILAALLRREVVDRLSIGDKPGQTKPFLVSRFALIKLCLLRSPNRKDHNTMRERLDPDSKDVAYLCGQLFAVLGRLQLLALGKVGASIAERTYGGVATRPATTLGPLFTKVPAYLKKANDRFGGAGTNKEKEIEGLCQRIEAQGGLPQTLALEDQARFALGYYCQLAEYRAKREEAEAEEKASQLGGEPV